MIFEKAQVIILSVSKSFIIKIKSNTYF